MTEPPATVRVGTRTYRLTFDPRDHAVQEAIHQRTLGGCSDHETLTITARTVDGTGAPIDQQVVKATVVHELLHSVLRGYAGFYAERFRPVLADGSHDIEETFVLALEAGLLDVLQSNPQLLDWLRHRTEAIPAGE